MTENTSTDDAIREAAREWLLRLSLDVPTPALLAQFQEWRAEDARHEAAFTRFEGIWRDSALLVDLTHLAQAEVPSRGWASRVASGISRLGRARVWAPALAAGAAAAFFWFSHGAVPDHYATRVAEVRDIVLPDGSQVTLSARSSIRVEFGERERTVALTAGEAFFSVTHDRNRPFVVVVGDKQIRVVGTKFNVHRDDKDVRVSVLEGTVEMQPVPSNTDAAAAAKPVSAQDISAARGSKSSQILTAGHETIAVLGGAIEPPQVSRNAEPGVWRRGRLVYVDAPLRDIVADVNRYSTRTVVLGDAAAGDLRVSVTFATSQITEMLNGLPSVLPIQIARAKDDTLVLRSR